MSKYGDHYALIWYWEHGVCSFALTNKADWFSDYYHMAGDDSMFAEGVEIDGVLIDPQTVPEYVEFARKKNAEAVDEFKKYLKKDQVLTHVRIKHPARSDKSTSVSIQPESLDAYKEYFGKRLTVIGSKP